MSMHGSTSISNRQLLNVTIAELDDIVTVSLKVTPSNLADSERDVGLDISAPGEPDTDVFGFSRATPPWEPF